MPDVTTQAPEPSLTALPEPSVRLGVTLANAALAASAIAQPSVSFPNEEIFIFGTPKRIWMVVYCFFSEAHARKLLRSIIHKGGPGPQPKVVLLATVRPGVVAFSPQTFDRPVGAKVPGTGVGKVSSLCDRSSGTHL